jgi:hypothetical protein
VVINDVLKEVDELARKAGIVRTTTEELKAGLLMGFARGGDRYIRGLDRGNFATARAAEIVSRAIAYFDRLEKSRRLGFFAFDRSELGRVCVFKILDPNRN